MTRRRAAGLGLILLVGLGVVVTRVWMVNATSADAFERRFNEVLPHESPRLYRLEIGRTRLAWMGGSLIAEDVRLAPDSTELARLGSAGTPHRAQYYLTVPRVELHGIGRRDWLQGRVSVRNVRLHEPELDVRFDRRIPGPEEVEEVPPPHHRLRRAAGDLWLAALQSRGGRIRYYERAEDGARFALLRFDSVAVDAQGITTREVSEDAHAIVPIRLAGLLGGRARIAAWIDYDLRAEDLTLSVTGGLGPTDERVFNQVLVDLEGIRIRELAVDTIHWSFDVDEGAARGRMVAVYSDFRVERLDKVTGEQSLGDQIVSFLGNTFRITPANPRWSGDAPEAVVLAHRRPPTEPFFKFLWVTLRGGLLETAGL